MPLAVCYNPNYIFQQCLQYYQHNPGTPWQIGGKCNVQNSGNQVFPQGEGHGQESRRGGQPNGTGRV